MKTSTYILIGLLLMVSETVISPHLSLNVLKPDLSTPIIMYTAFFLGASSGFIAAFFIGFFQEILSAAPNGSLLFVKVAIFLIAIAMRKKFFIDSKYSFAYVCTGAVIVESFLFLALSVLARGEAGNFYNVVFYAVPNAIVTGFLSMLLYSFITYLNTAYLERH